MKRATRARRDAKVASLKARPTTPERVATKRRRGTSLARSAHKRTAAARVSGRLDADLTRSSAPSLNPPDIDRETRDRLIDVAAVLFAEHGFDTVTVRDICAKASANVAAVNYHFGGKAGLYDEVLRWAIRIMQETTEEIRRVGEDQSPGSRRRFASS